MRGDWRRQPDEPNRAHALFQQYLELGPGRNLRLLSRRSGASYSYLKKLSHLWRWRERAAGWQTQVGQAGQLDEAELAAEARKRQIRDAHTLLQLSRAQLARWIARHPSGALTLRRRLTPHQAARFWQAGYRVEQGLLPPVTPQNQVSVERSLHSAKIEQEQEERRHEGRSSHRSWSLRKELASFILVLRRSGLPPSKVREHHARLLRWLWLPEEKSLSLEALGKANRSYRARQRHHGTRRRKARKAAQQAART